MYRSTTLNFDGNVSLYEKFPDSTLSCFCFFFCFVLFSFVSLFVSLLTMFFFSTECLLKLQELQGSVIECSSCKLRTLLPSNGVDGLDKNMDLLHAILQTEEEEQKLCNFCIRKVYPAKPATFYCSDCEVFMCGSCSDTIHSQLEFRCHGICRASEAKDGVVSLSDLQGQTVSSRPSSSSSTLSKRSSTNLRPTLTSSRPSSSLLNYASIPGR